MPEPDPTPDDTRAVREALADHPPCQRRRLGYAHGPHPVEIPTPDGDGTTEAECPGVRAHPATMIGGGARPAPGQDVTGPTAAE